MTHTGKLIKRLTLAPGTLQITIDLSGKDFSFQAGQYVSVTLPGLDDEAVMDQFHDFSIASGSRDNNHIEIIYKESLSIYKQHLAELKLGTEVEVEGPGGIFTFNRKESKQTWIAGGIGITPFLSMVRSGLPDDADIDLYYYLQNLQSAIYINELESAPLRLHIVEGRVNEASLDIDKRSESFMIAGPPGMVAETRRILKQRFTTESVKIQTEEFSGYESKG